MIVFQDFIKAIHNAVLTANDSLVKKNVDLFDEYFEVIESIDPLTGARAADQETTLKPKTVKILYPNQTEDGIVNKEVHVPLISIMPIAFTQITQLKLKTRLEIQDVNENLHVTFPLNSEKMESAKGTIPESEPKHYADIEITIEPHKGSAGLKQVIEGYEKMLRAQIPT